VGAADDVPRSAGQEVRNVGFMLESVNVCLENWTRKRLIFPVSDLAQRSSLPAHGSGRYGGHVGAADGVTILLEDLFVFKKTIQEEVAFLSQ
jgi:hypothetical protein